MVNTQLDNFSFRDPSVSKFLFEHSPSGILFLKLDGEVIRANQVWLNMVMYESSEIVGRSILQLIHSEDRNKFASLLGNSSTHPTSTSLEARDHRILRKDEKVLHTKITIGNFILKTDTPCLIAIIEDQSEIKQLKEQFENSLAELQERKEALEKAEFSLENTQIGVAWSDKDSRVAYTNRAYAEMVGIERDELVGMRVVDYRNYYNEESWKTHWEEMEKHKHKILELEFPPTKPEGMPIPVELSISHIEFKGNPFTIAFFRDISIRKKHLKKVEQQNREMEEFTYAASHDLQGPLKTITNYIKLLREDFGDDMGADAKKYLGVIFKSTNRMKILTNHLLDFSRLGQKREKVLVDCAEIIQTLQVDLQASIEESEACLEIGPMPKLIGYKTELRLLFQNLIMNAIKFRKKDIALTINIQAHEEANYWVFSVADNGIGIETAHQDRIFGIFQRLHTRKTYEGTGIGLAHCRKIAELHEGIIWVESQIGKGSTFFVKLKKY